MDQQNYYYAKYNIGSLNQAVFANAGSEFQANGFSDHSPLVHTSGLNFNINTNGTNTACTDPTNPSPTNLTRSTSNNAATNLSVNNYNATGPYSRLYSYIPDNNTTQNVSSSSSNAVDTNHITHGSAFNSKPCENTTNSTHVPVTAVTSSNSLTRGYHSNIGYGSYANVDYSFHKNLNQNYGAGAAMMATPSLPNRPSLSSSAAFAPNMSMEHMGQTPAKSQLTTEGKASSKTSVIKPLNAYNAAASGGSVPLNYTKFVQPYPMYTNNKTVPTLDKSPSTTSRGMYSSTNHKNSELYCPEPISARYTNPAYAINAQNTGHSNYMTAVNGYSLNYGHHLTQHQNTVPHSGSLLAAPTYQSTLDDNVSANYYNRQNGLLVRPTPNTYKQGAISYQNAYNYGRGNIASVHAAGTASHSTNSHSTYQKLQSQKSVDETINPLTYDYDGTYDRRGYRQYAYGATYIDPTSYEDYPQYSGYGTIGSSTMPFYATKTPSKIYYNYGSNMYNNNTTNAQATHHTSQPPVVSSSSTTGTAATSMVQQHSAFNPSSQMISSNYDTASFHKHQALQPPLFNNNTKEYSASNQYQQPPYVSQILYSTLQNSGYYAQIKQNQPAKASANVTEAQILPHKVNATKPLPPVEKFTTIDLEDEINSSKISKVSVSVIPNIQNSNQSVHNSVSKMPVVQNNQRQRKNDPCQIIESNKSACAYNNSYSNCYQTPQWTKQASPAHAPAPSTTTTYVHPKKQSLRDFLSSWNEDEEEETTDEYKKSPNPQGQSHAVNHTQDESHAKEIRFDKPNKSNENVPVIVHPVPPSAQVHPIRMQQTVPATTYSNSPSVLHNPPKILVDYIDNLPDIVIDIEKTKVSGEGECFERTNGNPQ